jgi:hypothetical protein
MFDPFLFASPAQGEAACRAGGAAQAFAAPGKQFFVMFAQPRNHGFAVTAPAQRGACKEIV